MLRLLRRNPPRCLLLRYQFRYARRSRLERKPTDPASAHTRQLKEARRHGKGRVDEGICRHDLAHYGKGKTPGRSIRTPFRYASRSARFKLRIALIQILYKRTA